MVLRNWFDEDVALFASGRDALLALLRNIGIEPGSEIIVQGFTCIALPNAIHAAGFSPVFVDADPETLNVDLQQLEGKISNRTRAIICQHTFGIVADTQKLRDIADKHQALLIEDCAHVLPDVTGPKVIGKHADFTMLSFGRDKAASGVTGGAILSSNPAIMANIKEEERKAKELGLLTVKRLILYPLIYALVKSLYSIKIGKGIAWLAGKMGMLVPVITSKEKTGFADTMLRRMPNACCSLVRNEFKRMHSINNHRRELTKVYAQAAAQYGWNIPHGVDANLPLQKFPIIVPDADALRSALKKRCIYLDDGWTGSSVCPRSVDQEAAGYIEGSCPKAERLARTVVSLPTHPTMSLEQAKKLIEILQFELTSSATMSRNGDT